jgi:polyribonucleotide nucleotidyltransferase
VVEKVKAFVERGPAEARQIPGKQDRNDAIDALRDRCSRAFRDSRRRAVLRSHGGGEARPRREGGLPPLEKKITRKLITEQQIRADGRKRDEIRPLDMRVGVFPRTHGSALFQRGETQSLVTCTLGTGRGRADRRRPAARVLQEVLPALQLPAVLRGRSRPHHGPGPARDRPRRPGRAFAAGGAAGCRGVPVHDPLVSDITESNGSSSMASVCGGCLALMDAGVPIRATVRGHLRRPLHRRRRHVTHVTDIIGEEDFFGEMDFKVSGTREGITGIQLDLKARGLWFDEIETIFEQAQVGRLE